VSQPGSNSVYSKQINTTKTRHNNKRKKGKPQLFQAPRKLTKNHQDYQNPKPKINHSDHTTYNNKRKRRTHKITQHRNKQQKGKENNKKKSLRNRCLTKTTRNTPPRR